MAREPEKLFERISQARVGGSFWGLQPQLPAGPITLICARSAADARRMIESSGAESVVVHLPRPGRVAGATVLAGDVDPWWLLAQSEAVHAHGDSEWSALAHIAGHVPVLHSAGEFDSVDKIKRALLATRYRNPFNGRPAGIEETIERLSEWRNLIDANRRVAAASGIAWWKRKEIEAFLWAPRPRGLLMTRSKRRALARAAREKGAIAIWPSRAPPGLTQRAAADRIPIVCVEDGFIRSVGLGSNLFPPLSVAVDTRGIYYDPTRPSDLEHLLETSDFTPDLLSRARALRDHLIAAGISKYGASEGELPVRSGRSRLILVPGQVEDDESVRLGGGEVAGNLDLLRRARALEPNSEIWFRPHPDVDAGHRAGAVADAEALQVADRVVRGGSMARLLDLVDGVHVISSLAGFEALIRAREVTVHGAPFFAGWGLTRDVGPTTPRRRRRLDMIELLAGTLILYPRYLDPVTRLPCPVEVLVDRMQSPSNGAESWLSRIRRWQGKLAGMRG